MILILDVGFVRAKIAGICIHSRHVLLSARIAKYNEILKPFVEVDLGFKKHFPRDVLGYKVRADICE